MDTSLAFARGEAARGNPVMVFDWEKATKLISASGALSASAGLRGDWEWTGGDILRDGLPIPRSDTYTYLASTWAIPELDLGDGPQPCWRYANESPGWDSSTYWPDEACALLGVATPAA